MQNNQSNAVWQRHVFICTYWGLNGSLPYMKSLVWLRCVSMMELAGIGTGEGVAVPAWQWKLWVFSNSLHAKMFGIECGWVVSK